MDASQAILQASAGGLVGMGCEAHEAKAIARKERHADKRKSRSEWKHANKIRRLNGKLDDRIVEATDVTEEEAALHASG